MRFPEKLVADLEYDFSPGLRHGLKILVNGIDLQACGHPALLEEFTLEEEFEGRRFRLLAGVKADNTEPDRCGYDVAYKNRLIEKNDCARAFGDYSSARFYAYLELLRDGELDWTLSRNKQSFEERDELYEYLLPRVEHLLVKADQMGRDIEFKHMEDNASSRLSAAVTKAIKEKRKKPEHREPRIDPDDHVETERRRRKAKKVDPADVGSVTADPNGGHIQVKLDYEHPENIGWVQEGKTVTIVHLNREFPFDFTDELTLVVTAASLYADYWVHKGHRKNDRQMDLELVDPSVAYIKEFSALLRNVVVGDRRRAAA